MVNALEQRSIPLEEGGDGVSSLYFCDGLLGRVGELGAIVLTLKWAECGRDSSRYSSVFRLTYLAGCSERSVARDGLLSWR